MTKAFKKIMAGLEDALATSKGEKSRGVAHVIDASDVAKIRKGLKLSQAKFALEFGLDPSAVRDWEQGRRSPDRAARVLMKVISSHPEIVRKAVRSA